MSDLSVEIGTDPEEREARARLLEWIGEHPGEHVMFIAKHFEWQARLLVYRLINLCEDDLITFEGDFGDKIFPANLVIANGIA